MARVPALTIAVERPYWKFLIRSEFICRVADIFEGAENQRDAVFVNEVVIDFFKLVSGDVSGGACVGIVGAGFSVEAADEP